MYVCEFLKLVMASLRCFFVFAFVFTNIGKISLCTGVADADGIFRQYPFGDPRNCLQSAAVKATQDEIPLNIMQVLPGTGWDNLRNIELGFVTELNYSRCQTTGDRRYLIPDNVYAIPVQHSMMQANAKLIHHWDDWKSYTSSTINAKASYLPFISGKFSRSFRDMKARFVNEKSQIARVELRHHFYSLKLQPNGALDSGFKSRLLEIASHIQNNRSRTADYLAEVLVKEYGTDYITSVEAGALLIQEDYIDDLYIKQSASHENQVTASAAVSLFGAELGGSYGNAYGTSSMNAYLTNRRYSKRETFGGMPYQVGTTLEDWEKSLANSMVAIDRSGFPLDFAITVVSLPELPRSTRRKLRFAVHSAIRRYYYANTYKGCVDPGSPNFDYTANLDLPEACMPPETNTTFAGIYQSCSSDGIEDLCSRIEQLNPLTGSLSCPVGYQPVMIADGDVRSSKTIRECHDVCRKKGALFWKKKICVPECQNVPYSTTAKFQSYWCAAVGEVPYNTGYLFGGLFSSRKVNPVTGARSCPEHYFGLRLGTDVTVCVSNDYELGGVNSLPFAGFHSCLSGNPLAADRNDTSGVPPNRCPCGFSQHFAGIISNCQTNYCVRSGKLKIKELPEIILPPFKKKPVENKWSTKTVAVHSIDGELWVRKNGTNGWRMVQSTRDKLVKDDHSTVSGVDSSFSVSPFCVLLALAMAMIATQ